jgi:hypothetical protein
MTEHMPLLAHPLTLHTVNINIDINVNTDIPAD